MSSPFDSSRAKLSRADVHLDTLRSELDVWFEPHSHRRTLEIEREGPWHVLFVQPFAEDPPPHLSAICGDVLTNLRAALDHSVADAIRKRGKTPRRSGFPICRNEKEWCSRVVSPKDPSNNPLGGLNPQGEAWAIIRQAQPYQSRDIEADNIAILSLLVNRDKHSTLMIQMAFPAPDTLDGLLEWDEGAVLLERKQAVPSPLSLSQRTELERLRFDPASPPPNVRVKGRLGIDPTFGDETRQATLGRLRLIRDDVGQIVEKLALAGS
jgi:hypothetical protein